MLDAARDGWHQFPNRCREGCMALIINIKNSMVDTPLWFKWGGHLEKVTSDLTSRTFAHLFAHHDVDPTS